MFDEQNRTYLNQGIGLWIEGAEKSCDSLGLVQINPGLRTVQCLQFDCPREFSQLLFERW